MYRRFTMACAGAAIALAALPEHAAEARIYKQFSTEAPISADGGDDRDLFQIAVEDANFPSGTVAIELSPSTGAATTMMAYDYRLREVARASSQDDRPVNLTFPAAQGGIFYIRVVPTGGAFDTPQGTNFRRSALPEFGNRAMLASYSLKASDGSVVTASTPATSTASLPASPPPQAPQITASTQFADRKVPPASGEPLDAKLLVKQWGALAELDGTLWSEGKDQVMGYRWLEPGRRFEIMVRGLWGRRTIAATPGTAKDGLSVVVEYPDTNDRAAGTLKPSRSGYVLTAGGERETCTRSKAGMVCGIETMAAGKWLPDSRFAFASTTTAAAAQLLARLTDVFPVRPAGWFDPAIGAFGNNDRLYVTGAANLMLLDGHPDARNPSLSYGYLSPGGQYQSYEWYARNPTRGIFIPKGMVNDGQLRAEIFAGRAESKRTMDSIVSKPIRVMRGGQILIDYGTSARRLALSADRSAVLVRDGRIKGGRFEPGAGDIARRERVPADTRIWGALAKMPGTLWSDRHLRQSYHWIDDNRMLKRNYIISYDEPAVIDAVCVIEKASPGFKETCNWASGSKGEYHYTNVTQDGFLYRSEQYRLSDIIDAQGRKLTTLARSDSKGKSLGSRMPIEWSGFLSSWRSGSERIRSEQLYAQYRQRRADEEREAAMWQNAFASVLGNMQSWQQSNPIFQPSPYIGATTSGSGNLPGMGGSYHVALPPATMAQRMQQEELAAYEARRQIYAPSQGGYTDAEKYDRASAEARRNAQADREVREAEMRQDRLRAQDRAVQDVQTQAHLQQMAEFSGSKAAPPAALGVAPATATATAKPAPPAADPTVSSPQQAQARPKPPSAPAPARKPPTRSLRFFLAVVAPLKDSDKRQPMCISRIITVRAPPSWASGTFKLEESTAAAQPFFQEFVDGCALVRRDTRKASLATVSVYANNVSDQQLDEYHATQKGWHVAM